MVLFHGQFCLLFFFNKVIQLHDFCIHVPELPLSSKLIRVLLIQAHDDHALMFATLRLEHTALDARTSRCMSTLRP